MSLELRPAGNATEEFRLDREIVFLAAIPVPLLPLSLLPASLGRKCSRSSGAVHGSAHVKLAG
jgi:hypothetical protein